MSCKLGGLKEKRRHLEAGGRAQPADPRGCQESPSLVIGILRFVLKHVAAGETEVFQFLLEALAVHSDAFGGAGDIAAGFGEHAFDVGALEFAARFAEIFKVRDGQNFRRLGGFGRRRALKRLGGLCRPLAPI